MSIDFAETGGRSWRVTWDACSGGSSAELWRVSANK